MADDDHFSGTDSRDEDQQLIKILTQEIVSHKTPKVANKFATISRSSAESEQAITSSGHWLDAAIHWVTDFTVRVGMHVPRLQGHTQTPTHLHSYIIL